MRRLLLKLERLPLPETRRELYLLAIPMFLVGCYLLATGLPDLATVGRVRTGLLFTGLGLMFLALGVLYVLPHDRPRLRLAAAVFVVVAAVSSILAALLTTSIGAVSTFIAVRVLQALALGVVLYLLFVAYRYYHHRRSGRR